MPAAVRWDDIVEDLAWMRDTGESQLGAMARLKSSGLYTSSLTSLADGLRRRGKDATLVAWLIEGPENDSAPITKAEARKMASTYDNMTRFN